jgi:pimeloyl-ACP methyl ester carboxylesterase
MTATAFRIDIPEADIADLHGRLRRTRWVEDFANDDWRYGTPATYLKPFVEYWLHEYDWRRQEAAMNEFHHYKVELDGVPIHFIHEPGRGKRTVPLILNHGWPMTFWDYKKVIRPLADPASVGASDEIAFDVVVPSLPGYAFSSPLRRPGIGAEQTADLWARLMTEVLGYERFGTQGGDLGAWISVHLGHAYADRVIGVHLTDAVVLGHELADEITREDYAPEEAAWYPVHKEKYPTILPHLSANTQCPQTLGWGMNDSPVGLAAWVIERCRAYSGEALATDVDEVLSRDYLATLVSLLWLTGTTATAARFYAETFTSAFSPRHHRSPALDVPTAVATFPGDLLMLPRKLAEHHMNLHRWTIMPAGGHFPATEQPELLTQDIRAFYASLLLSTSGPTSKDEMAVSVE